MLEKIGLPAKPSLRGNNWVVDASHCQGCSSQFTFINRKHHCRRCGGLFCNSCTQQRMLLRGQGDSPVRICEACKKLEEAARFELRYGKSRTGRGGAKVTSRDEDDILVQILGDEGKELSSSGQASSSDMVFRGRGISMKEDGGDIFEVLSSDQPIESESTTPDELRQQGLEEKKKYRTLKAEGKNEEALKAFKRGKELERQAAALEISLRKNRRKALSSSNATEIQKDQDGPRTSARNSRLSSQKSEDKDDLASELRQLGWSEKDLHAAEKKPANLSLEGELSTLIGEVSQKGDSGKKKSSTDKSLVIAYKKRALELKREGKLSEAKEELKKAKVLEKQIEEEELLGDDEDSDEELSALIRSMNSDKQDDMSSYKPGTSFNFDNLGFIADEVGVDNNLDVTEEDMDDPEIAAALKSFGWSEDLPQTDEFGSPSVPVDREALLSEIQSLKREAVTQKRAGNTQEAMALLKKAKAIERDIDLSNSGGASLTANNYSVAQKDLFHQNQDESSVMPDARSFDERQNVVAKTAPRTKLMIQKELLSLKKKALALRREGKLDEAEEELKRGKDLERQLEEIENAKLVPSAINHRQSVSNTATITADEEVTDQDMHDPSYLSLLENLGWKEEDDEISPSRTSKGHESAHVRVGNSSLIQTSPNIPAVTSRKSKSEIQRELLGLKRKSLALRRQGETDEAEEVLKMARVLETQLEEIDAPRQQDFIAEPKEPKGNATFDSVVEHSNFSFQPESEMSLTEDPGDKAKVTAEKPEEMVLSIEKPSVSESKSSVEVNNPNDSGYLQQDILSHKRKAVALKREGRLLEAKEELRQAKILEKRLEDSCQPTTITKDVSGNDVPSERNKETSPTTGSKALSSRERFKLQQESLSHKRQALKLRREGRTEEADAELELARSLELQLEESAASSENAAEPLDDVSVDNFLDPQLLSALRAIGLEDTSIKSQSPERSESIKPEGVKKDNSNEDRMQLEERIKAEKLKAVNFKRSGKQAEALDALRRAKLFEKKLKSLAA